MNIKSILEGVRSWFQKSHSANPTAFRIEFLGFLFTVGASFFLAMYADQPDMRYIYPFFFVGSVCSVISTRLRNIAWPFVTACYFVSVNILGFGRSLGYW